MMMKQFLVVVSCWMFVALAESSSEAADCYFRRDNVGCDPEGYGYEAANCPSNCTEQNSQQYSGCTDSTGTAHEFLIKHAFFDSMSFLYPGEGDQPGDTASYEEDVTKEWKYNICLKEGVCWCEELTSQYGTSGYVCRSEEYYAWEEWYPVLTNTECHFELADDPCDCQGDPECEYYCYY
ncbi:MAG: hypothetical protein F9B45_06995 [Phycisphaera sp. RhM]|nr:hypothetical protein [Phycisphaera sp. RhM]